MKKCSTCGIVKNLSEFGKHKTGKDGLCYQCKNCVNLRSKEYREQHREERAEYAKQNKEEIAKQKKEYHEQNREYFAACYKEWYKQNKGKRAEYRKEYYAQNKEKVAAHNTTPAVSARRREREKNRRRTDFMYALQRRIGSMVWKSLKGKGGKRTFDLLGYTVNDLKQHLEGLFTDGMSWANRDKWHIDHIIPVSFFQFTDVRDPEFRMCWRLENLQPLWAEDNLAKSNKLTID